MIGKHHGVDFESTSLPLNGQHQGVYLLVFHNDEITYVVKKCLNDFYETSLEAEIKASQIAKIQIENSYF